MMRIKRVINYMTSRGGNKIPKVVSRIAVEMLSELSDVPPPIVELYTRQTAALLMWVSSGEIDPDIPLPDGFVI